MNSKLHTIFTLSLAALLCTSVLACGDAGDSEDPETSEVSSEQEFTEAVPDMSVFGLELDGASTSSQGLTVTQQGLNGPGSLRQHTENVLRGTRELLRDTHERIQTLTENTTPLEVEGENATCKVWAADGAQAHWQFTSCAADRAAKRYTFLLRGRPLDGTRDDFVPVFAGEGFVLPRHENKKRGAGRVGYDFNNIAALTGASVSGKLGIGYRAAGRMRQLNIGMKNVTGASFDQPLSSGYRFNHVIGKGGVFHYLTHHDLVTMGDDGLEFGEDGQREFGRATVAWSTQGAARAAMALCGGTLGEGECRRVYQCWQADGDVTFQDIVDRDSDAQWEATSCAEVFEDLQRPPAESELEPNDTGSDEVGAPTMQVPEEGADE